MASYHLSAKIGKKGKAGPHAAYLSREGKYQGRDRYEDLEATGAGNMPAWADHNPINFWEAADEHERENGSTYREIEVALPRELDAEQRRELVEAFVAQELGGKHAYQWAIHTPKAALEGGEQPHAHIMYSERIIDGVERDPDQYFKRYNSKNPDRGGCQKASGGKARGALKEELVACRQRWAELQNAHLERHGHVARVDHRSLADQGIARDPEKHLGPGRAQVLQERDITALLERRAAEGVLLRELRHVSAVIDLSMDLQAAKADRARHMEAQRQAVETERMRGEAAAQQQAQERAKKAQEALEAKAREEDAKAKENALKAPLIDYRAALIAEVGRMTEGRAQCFERDGIRSTGTVFAVNEQFAAQDTGRLQVRIMDRMQIPVGLGEWTVETNGSIKAGQLRDGGKRLQSIYGKGVTEQMEQAPHPVPSLGKGQGVER